MTRQHVSRTHQQSKSDTPLVSGILQRAAVRTVPENEVQPTQEEEVTTFGESRFHHNFCQVPVSTGEMPMIQPKLKIGQPKDRDEQEADVMGNSSPLKQEASPDERKEAAKNKFISLMEAKKSMSREEMEGVLVNLKTEFQLSEAKLEGKLPNPKIAFYASKALFLPLGGFLAPISGLNAAATAKAAAAAAAGALATAAATALGATPANAAIAGAAAAAASPQYKSVKQGDYIKATRYDGPFPTPGQEVVTEFDNVFKNQNTTHNNGTAPVKFVKVPKGKLALYKVQAINPKTLPLHTKTNANTYRRAGIVKAKSSVTRGAGRSGAGETVFGHFGADEERILTGNLKTNYNGGHLVGDQIMDSHQAFNLYEDWNLAPQVRTFNSPVYTGTIENTVTKAIKAGATIEYTVQVQYPDDTYKIKPSDLVKKLFPAAQGYRKEVEGAIARDPNLDIPFTLRRRTPGFWQATAEVVGGGKTINSGKINVRPNVAFEKAQVNVKPGVIYAPMAPEQVRYSLETDIGKGAGFQPLAGPTPKNPLIYTGANKVRETARQQTF